jgi:hypothetical protein
MTGAPIIVSQGRLGEVTRLTFHFLGAQFSFLKVSDQPPKLYEPPKLRAAIKLDTKLLDACVGQYEFPSHPVWPPAGLKMTIWREGDHLFLKALAKDIVPTIIKIYPESETNFFLKISDEQLTFIKNHEGDVTTLIHHTTGLPDCQGKKLQNGSSK